jgi:hypothetical protein
MYSGFSAYTAPQAMVSTQSSLSAMQFLASNTAHRSLPQRASRICVLAELSVLVVYVQCQMMFICEG